MHADVAVADRHAVRIRGDGPDNFLFAHGFGCDQTMWDAVIPHFSAPPRRAVSYDLMGFGSSDRRFYERARYDSLQGHAEDLIAITAAHCPRPPVFVGHSVAATIGVIAENMRPGLFSALVLVAPSPRYVNDGDYVGGFEPAAMDDMLGMLDSNYLGWSRALAPVIIGPGNDAAHAQRLEQHLCLTDPEIARHCARVTFLGDARADYARLKARCLILQCAEDVIAPRAVGAYLHRTMADAELVEMGATGHCPHLTAPQEVVAAIMQFTAGEKAA
jgi:sigma-B regulation protein RsbQ